MAALRRKIRETELELDRLKEDLRLAEAGEARDGHSEDPVAQSAEEKSWRWPLSPEDYERYARQLIIPQVGVLGMSSAHKGRGEILTFHKGSYVSRRQLC